MCKYVSDAHGNRRNDAICLSDQAEPTALTLGAASLMREFRAAFRSLHA
jgi:hypothetical protein